MDLAPQRLTQNATDTNADGDDALYHDAYHLTSRTHHRMTIHHFIIPPHSVVLDSPTHPTVLSDKTWMESFSDDGKKTRWWTRSTRLF